MSSAPARGGAANWWSRKLVAVGGGSPPHLRSSARACGYTRGITPRKATFIQTKFPRIAIMSFWP